MTPCNRHFRTARILAFALVISAVPTVYGMELLPKPTRVVSDMAGVLLPEEVQQLEGRLQSLRESVLAEAIIYIRPSLPQGTSIELATSGALDVWGIGGLRKNGLAIFVFVDDRKQRIVVGRGLEERVSKAAAAAIVEEELAPLIQQNRYAQGLNAAIDGIEAAWTPEVRYVQTSLGAARRIVDVNNTPRPTRRVNPHFPDAARRDRTQGIVQMEVLIDKSGRVHKVTVKKGLPNGLNDAAVDAVKQWGFEPVVVDGVAVPAVFDFIMSFKL